MPSLLFPARPPIPLSAGRLTWPMVHTGLRQLRRKMGSLLGNGTPDPRCRHTSPKRNKKDERCLLSRYFRRKNTVIANQFAQTFKCQAFSSCQGYLGRATQCDETAMVRSVPENNCTPFLHDCKNKGRPRRLEKILGAFLRAIQFKSIVQG
jgi:hypothetical protein